MKNRILISNIKIDRESTALIGNAIELFYETEIIGFFDFLQEPEIELTKIIPNLINSNRNTVSDLYKNTKNKVFPYKKTRDMFYLTPFFQIYEFFIKYESVNEINYTVFIHMGFTDIINAQKSSLNSNKKIWLYKR